MIGYKINIQNFFYFYNPALSNLKVKLRKQFHLQKHQNNKTLGDKLNKRNAKLRILQL